MTAIFQTISGDWLQNECKISPCIDTSELGWFGVRVRAKHSVVSSVKNHQKCYTGNVFRIMIELSSALETPRLKRKLGIRSHTAVRQKKKKKKKPSQKRQKQEKKTKKNKRSRRRISLTITQRESFKMSKSFPSKNTKHNRERRRTNIL